MQKVVWGVLSTARIGLKRVLPGMRKSDRLEIRAIASRSLPAARAAADALGIPRAYGSYEELLADPEIEAVYNPLPNHLHVPWTLKAAEAGKLRPLAGWGAKRVEALPDVPTFRELGYDAEFYIWAGLFAPRGTPEPIMKKLRDTVRAPVQEPDFKSAMAKMETPIAYMDAPEFEKFWDKDAKMLTAAIKRIGRIEEK